MTSGASRCVLFQKTAAVLSSLLYLSPMGEVMIISTCLSAKTQGHKGCLFFKRSCGPAYICSDNSSHFQQKTAYLLQLTTKWGAKSTKRAFDLQGWCSQKQHGRCSHDRRYQHVPCNCAPAATRHTNKAML